MAGAIIYLDIDDEITSAAARVREVDGRRAAIVLPYGSRVATSRINLRLLSRDALINEKQLAVIANDPATRALAASAGLPVFGSVAEYESSLAGSGMGAAEEGSAGASVAAAAELTSAQAGVPSPSTRTTRRKKSAPAAPSAPFAPVAEDHRPTAVLGPASGGPVVAPYSRPPDRRGRSRVALAVVLGVLALLVLLGGVGAYVWLPSATIVVTPRPEAVAPVRLTIRADPAVAEPNAETLVVPAVEVPLDVDVSDTFAATGVRVEEATAKGRVRFSNLDFLRTNTVPKGSVVSTNAGVRFRTDASVTVPRADLIGLTLFPGRITVGVTAVEPGLAANVEPNTIVIVPRGEDPQALKVVNPDAVTGGTHEEFKLIAQADVDAAMQQLKTSLDAAYQSRLADPSIVPPGTSLVKETATIGASTPTVDPATLVGKELDTFDLGLAATGMVMAVDEAPISAIAEQKVRASVKPDHELVAGSVEVSVGPASVSGRIVTFTATASAREVATLDPGTLKTMVLGKSLDDARLILARYGDATVTAWPDWVGSIPTIDSRVGVSVEESVPVETAAPTSSPQ